LRERIDEIARLETLNCGKIIVESRGDVTASANCFEYYGNLATQIWGEQIPMNGPLLDYTLREPIGVCAQIVPWNFPLLMSAWKVAPAIAVGNTVILKPATVTPITAVLLGEICREAGIPDGVVNVLPGPGREIGDALVGHPLVDKVAFTGETETGRAIMARGAETIKHVSLELGGKNPNIVFPDADIDEAIDGSLFAIYANAGQRCTSRTRLFLHTSIYDRFLSDFVAKAKQIRIGNPLEWETQMGPVVSPNQERKVLEYCQIATNDGAELLAGGRKSPDAALKAGNFIEPTIFGAVSQSMRLAQEEVFGPVLAVIPFKDEDEVVSMANSTIYGLAATVWTQDIKRAHTLARRLHAGNVSINYPTVNPPEAPFGGYKQSGLGRELSRHVIDLYTQVKNVVVNLNPQPFDWYGRWPERP
jgi:acyl-CoA reductase-like NAD-dependent aldehyde dehydrogenase